jgi:SAM-dependent methyltransferase
MHAGRSMAPYFAGESLWGDDFTDEEIAEWFEDEREASFRLGVTPHTGGYPWAEQQRRHCFSHLPPRRWSHVLGFGSATGIELVPLDAEKATIVDSTDMWQPAAELSFPVEYVAADPYGDVALPDRSVDLVVALGVLHHIANVSHVLGEFARISRFDGYLVLAEPVISMGDWREPRAGLTSRERGLPVGWLRDALARVGYSIERERLVNFPGIRALQPLTSKSVWNSRSLVALDAAICRLIGRWLRYHAVSPWQKLRPTGVALVARRAT